MESRYKHNLALTKLFVKEKPFVVLPLKEYESLIATNEELYDADAMVALRESSLDIKEGRVFSHEQVF